MKILEKWFYKIAEVVVCLIFFGLVFFISCWFGYELGSFAVRICG